jgi:hypothetical protein
VAESGQPLQLLTTIITPILPFCPSAGSAGRPTEMTSTAGAPSRTSAVDPANSEEPVALLPDAAHVPLFPLSFLSSGRSMIRRFTGNTLPKVLYVSPK